MCSSLPVEDLALWWFWRLSLRRDFLFTVSEPRRMEGGWRFTVSCRLWSLNKVCIRARSREDTSQPFRTTISSPGLRPINDIKQQEWRKCDLQKWYVKKLVSSLQRILCSLFKYQKYFSNISNQHNLHKLRDKSKCTFAESKPIRENFTDNDTAVFEVVYIACNSKALRTREKKKLWETVRIINCHQSPWA